MTGTKIEASAVVLGMHRSGTSSLTRVLDLHGFTLPSNLIPANAANESGFWESSKINVFNDEILKSLNRTWFSFESIDPNWVEAAGAASWRMRARKLILEEFGGASDLLLKDPRICRLVGFWFGVLSEISPRVVAPFIIRNPIEVAQSLNRRNGFERELSQLVWLRYNLDAESGTRGQTRSFVNYQSLLDDWRAVVDRIARELSIPIETTAEVAAKIDGFINPELQHHRTNHDAVMMEIGGSPWIGAAYDILHRWGEGGTPNTDEFATLDEIRASIDTAAPTFAPMVYRGRLDRKQVVSLAAKLDTSSAELNKARQALEDFASLRATTEAHDAQLRMVAATVTQALADVAQQTASAARQTEQAQRLVEAATRDRDTLAQQRDAIALERDALAVERDALALARDGLALKNLKVESELAGALGRLSETKNAIAIHRADRDELQKQLLAYAGDKRVLTVRLDEARATIKEHIADNLNLRKDVAQLRSSLDKVQEKYKRMTEKFVSAQASIAMRIEEVKRARSATAAKAVELKRTGAALQNALAEIDAMKASWGWRLQRFFVELLPRLLKLRRARSRSNRSIADIIRASPLFDADWYLEQYHDVEQSKIDPALHYVTNGWREGRNPSAKFDAGKYLKANADVAAAGINPLLHFLEHGQIEGREVIDFTPVAWPKSTEKVGPAHECVGQPAPKQTFAHWTSRSDVA